MRIYHSRRVKVVVVVGGGGGGGGGGGAGGRRGVGGVILEQQQYYTSISDFSGLTIFWLIRDICERARKALISFASRLV